MVINHNMKIKLPGGVNEIIARLYEGGYEAYAVGGCVRDSLLGKTPGDWDITTSAEPETVMKIFRGNRSIPTGLKHGTVTVLAQGGAYEVTTYRIDGNYADGRRPDSVSFTNTLKEDLNRRDFTINAMAYNDRAGLVDCFNGMADLGHKIIRCVGDAEERFSEDYLRMLRAYRFAAVLDFRMEEKLERACMANREKINQISAERIRTELDKILLSENFAMTRKFINDFSDVLLSEIFALKGVTQNNQYHYLDVYDHTLTVFENTPNDLDMRLTALFHDIGKKEKKRTDENGTDHFYGHPERSAAMAEIILKRLKYDNKTTATVLDLIKTHDDRLAPEKPSLRRLINQLGEEKAYKNLQFQYADACGQSDFSKQENMPRLLKCFQLYKEIIADGDPCTIKALAVSGKDVIEVLGIRPGEAVGTVLNELLAMVLADPGLNTRPQLIGLMQASEF